MTNKKFYITTAIAYPNARPHMGHALEIIQADALARMYRMIGKDVEFQTGTDEHGVKNRRTAQKEGKEILEFLDENVSAFKELYSKLQISHDTFLRTSDKQIHYPGAQKLWNKLVEAGDIEKKSYTGLYCAGCEKFITEKELIDGKCPEHPSLNIEEIQEENYFFKLSKYKDEIINDIETNTYEIYPESRKKEILEFLKNAQDISFSRPKSSLPRGIPVPDDPEHVMYVWCDALSNYITGQGYENDEERFNNTRPADIHLIGKDILRFHAAFRPAMLKSAKIALPKKLLVHGFLTLNGARMSKSTGNVVDPIEILDLVPRDGFVFNLLYDVPLNNDGDFSKDRLLNIYDSMVIGGWGNLVNRVTSLCAKYGINEINKSAITIDRVRKILPLKDKDSIYPEGLRGILLEPEKAGDYPNSILGDSYLKYGAIQLYLKDRYQIVQGANEYITKAEPRIKRKNEETKEEAKSDLQFLLYIVKNLALLSAPVLVDGFKKIQEIFNNDELNKIDSSKNTNDPELFKKVFDMKEFKVNLNPQIIYKRIEA